MIVVGTAHDGRRGESIFVVPLGDNGKGFDNGKGREEINALTIPDRNFVKGLN